MANRHRGEVALLIGDATYTLCFSINSLCSLEELLNKSVNEIMAGIGDGSKVRLGTVRALVWAGLSEKHPEITVKDAGRIITEGGTAEVMAKVTEALEAAFPPPEAKAAEARPT